MSAIMECNGSVLGSGRCNGAVMGGRTPRLSEQYRTQEPELCSIVYQSRVAHCSEDQSYTGAANLVHRGNCRKKSLSHRF